MYSCQLPVSPVKGFRNFFTINFRPNLDFPDFGSLNQFKIEVFPASAAELAAGSRYSFKPARRTVSSHRVPLAIVTENSEVYGPKQ